jgi:NAD(P)-dependent dehydrogenase (short-subunit alcohol dehydrogenase family)
MPENSPRNRGTVLVTGSSTGIGQACALYLDMLGFGVFAGVRRDEDGAALRSKASSWLTPIHLDITDPASIAGARQIIEQTAGETGLAGLVNNAGVSIAGPLEFMPIAEFRRQLEINVVGQLAVTQAFLPLLRKARGRIVNMSSIAGRSAAPFNGPYAASKHALEAMSDALRMELVSWGIGVAVVEPGSIATPIWEKSGKTAGAIARQLPPQARELYGRMYDAMRTAAARIAQRGEPPVEVAKVVAHALTAKKPKTRYLVGRRAKIQARLKNILPDRMLDRLTLNYLGLQSKS